MSDVALATPTIRSPSAEFWRRFRRAIRARFPEAYLVAEDWGDATHRFLGDTFDATMNYRFGYSVMGFAAGKVSPAELDDRLQTLRRDTPLPTVMPHHAADEDSAP